MGVYQRVANFDHDVHNRSRRQPKFLNDVERTEDNPLISKLEGDTFSVIPTCECGETSGQAAIGRTCRHCNTEVKSAIDQELEPEYWIRTPIGVPYLINPVLVSMLIKAFDSDTVMYLLDSTFTTPHSTSNSRVPIYKLMSTVSAPEHRNMDYFRENFDAIMEELIALKYAKSNDNAPKRRASKGEASIEYTRHSDSLREFIQTNRELLFCNHIPVPHRSLMVLEQNSLGSYMDATTVLAVNPYNTFVGIDQFIPTTGIDRRHAIQRQRKVARALVALGQYNIRMYSDSLGSKPGTFRKHVFGSRAHFCLRAVISSNTGDHQHDQLTIPWELGLSCLRLHVTNKLIRRGYRPMAIDALIDQHFSTYHPVLDEIFQELIAEAGPKGIPCVGARHPSLQVGSTQRFYISRINRDTSDNTAHLSILVVRPLNADYDGDELSFTLILDDLLCGELDKLAPYRSCFNLDQVLKVSGDMWIPKPVISSMSNWHRMGGLATASQSDVQATAAFLSSL